MVSDPIADMLARIKNASMAGRQTLTVPYSKMKESVAHILVNEAYLNSVTITGEGYKRDLILTIRYQDKKPVITSLSRKSKPGRRLYINKAEIPVVLGGVGIVILSTPQGLMTGTEAKKRGIGGELLCEIW